MKYIMMSLLVFVIAVSPVHAREGSTGSTNNSGDGRLSLDINNYTIDGQSAAEKIEEAKSGKFGSVALSAGGGGGGSCTDACDCSGTFEACIGGSCQDITGGGAWECSTGGNGHLVKGDENCQYYCNSGYFTCSAGGACGAR